MARWTDPRNLGKNDRIQTSDGSTVTLSGPPESTDLKHGNKTVPAVTVSGRRDGSGEDYRAVVPDGQRVKKIV